MSQQVAKIVSQQFLEILESGMVSGQWEAPWSRGNGGVPYNATNNRRYNGMNVLLLWAAQHRNGFSTAQWATLRAWNAAGAKVIKGSKSQIIIHWRLYEKTDSQGNVSTGGTLSYYKVFNADQVTGWTAPAAPVKEFERNAECERIIAATGAVIRHGGDRACFIPSIDEIRLPEFASFNRAENYYSTAFHELAHWSGAKSRLDRDLSGRFGSHAYGMEELVAELSAAFTCAVLGFESETRADHLRYIKSWIAAIRENNFAIITAASKADKASQFILNGANVVKEDQAIAA